MNINISVLDYMGSSSMIAATFVAASLIHSGALVAGYEHRQARIAESVIAIVLLAGLLSTWIRPAWTRRAAVAAQAFALLATLVGFFMIVVGVGPRTIPDIVYHAGIVVVLAAGLGLATRVGSDAPERRA